MADANQAVPVTTITNETVEAMNAVYDLLERIQKEQKELREKLGRDEKELKDDDVRLIDAATKAIRGMKKKKLEMIEEIAKAAPAEKT